MASLGMCLLWLVLAMAVVNEAVLARAVLTVAVLTVAARAQAVIIGLGWSPEATLRRCRGSSLSPAATELEQREQGPLLSVHDASRNASGLNLALEHYAAEPESEPDAPGDTPTKVR